MSDFTGFRFNNVHSKDLNLVVVSSSDRYEKNLLPENNDYTLAVDGVQGKYYFGSTYNEREFTIDVAFDSVDEKTFRRISQLFSTDKPSDLIFDELPYKTYRAKLKSKPEFKTICFMNRKTKQRVYKGEGTLEFICYFPYAFGFNKYVVRAADYYECLAPENIIKNSTKNNPYEVEEPKYLPGVVKDHFNRKPNVEPWKGGFPTIQQVQWGELYFDFKESQEKVHGCAGYSWDDIAWAFDLLGDGVVGVDDAACYLSVYACFSTSELLKDVMSTIFEEKEYTDDTFLQIETKFNDLYPLHDNVKQAYNFSQNYKYKIGDILSFYDGRFHNGLKQKHQINTITKTSSDKFLFGESGNTAIKDPYSDYHFEDMFQPGFTLYNTDYVSGQTTEEYNEIFIQKIQIVQDLQVNIEPSFTSNIFSIVKNYFLHDDLGYMTKDEFIEYCRTHNTFFTYQPTITLVENPSNATTTTKKLLIDVRGYWDNVPKWEDTAKLLTTPTLDYEQELIFLPQYNRTQYVNMEIGSNEKQSLIGSRLLVYNPGDVPIEFELKLCNLKKRLRASEKPYSFRISRYNVDRMSIENAVDWTGLRTHYEEDEIPYKYGNRYFRILEQTGEKIEIPLNDDEEDGETISYNDFEFRTLKGSHPRHCYLVEPIPREKLGHYIKLFYWQSYKLNLLSEEEWQDSIEIANRYDELLSNCIYEEEKQELYWTTLKTVILENYREFITPFTTTKTETFDDFIYNYFYSPPEYIKEKTSIEHNYGDVDFNLSILPPYIADDYLQINAEKLFDTVDLTNRNDTIPNLFLDTEKQMLYSVIDPEWRNAADADIQSFYNYQPSKKIQNEAIEKGHWFNIPPGWSLIDVSPIVDEDRWGGKLWEDAKAFTWAEKDEKKHKEFMAIYERALREYVQRYCPSHILMRYISEKDVKTTLEDMELSELEKYAQFRRWYTQDYDENENFYGEYNLNLDGGIFSQHHIYLDWVHKMNEDAEYRFLKLLSQYWIVAHTNDNGEVTSSIDDWWWYANNYIWSNFPPLYWGFMDLLNQMEIKYTPLFY